MEEAASEAESQRSLQEILDSIGEPAGQAPPGGENHFDGEWGDAKAEIVEFLQEDIVRLKGPDAPPLSPEEASRVDDAKAGVNKASRNIDLLLERIPQRALRSAILAEFSGAILSAYVLGNYSTLSQSMGDWLEKIHTKRVAIRRGKKGGESRKKEAAEGWHPSAKKLAKQKRAEDPNASKASVARYIRSNWTLKYELPEDDRALVRLVSDMERKGELAPRTKKNRM
jgi:hypothetical protein